MILTLALVIVKVLSAIYRVPYQNILGDSGLYAYQQIYPIVALGMILSMNAVLVLSLKYLEVTVELKYFQNTSKISNDRSYYF